jgi:feruloyl esterase
MFRFLTLAAAAAAALTACGGGDEGLPRLAPATGAALSGTCASLQARIAFADTTISDAQEVAPAR